MTITNTNITRQELILKLLRDFHLNVQDRKVFNDSPLTIAEMEFGIQSVLSTNKFFPNKFSSWDSEVFNYDGCVIEKISENKYFVHFQISGATMNLLESKTFSFDGIDKAIDFYIKAEFKEGNIDGIPIKQKCEFDEKMPNA